MTRLNYIMVLAGVLLVSWGVVATMVASLQTKRVKEYRTQIEFDRRAIDSLITLPRKTFDVALSVTDNSRTTLNARKQSGEITFPNTKVYELRIDSLSLYEKVCKKD